MSQHMWVHSGHSHAGGVGEMQAARGGVPVHPPSGPVQQDRPANPSGDGSVNRAGLRWGQGDESDSTALANHPQDAVTVFLA